MIASAKRLASFAFASVVLIRLCCRSEVVSACNNALRWLAVRLSFLPSTLCLMGLSVQELTNRQCRRHNEAIIVQSTSADPACRADQTEATYSCDAPSSFR